MKNQKINALICDVFGTVVDWRGSIIREGRAFGRAKGLDVDWTAFADAWRAGYKPAMDKVRNKTLPWMNIDRLHRLILDDLLVEVRHPHAERSRQGTSQPRMAPAEALARFGARAQAPEETLRDLATCRTATWRC